MRKIVLLFAFLWALGMNAQMPQELPFDSMVTKGVLPNGLTYYLQHNENPKERAYFYIAQKVGSVEEEEDQRGLAHFLEHMCFNGSEHFPGNSLVNFCQKIGVQFGNHLNAYTAADRTVYNIDNVPTTDSKNLDSCLYILYDWAHALLLDPVEIDKERAVIHEEWRVRNSGTSRILERQLPILMPGRYGQRYPIGLMSVVDNFKPAALRAYYDKWYRPDLQGIVIIGDFDVKQMEQKVKDIFGKLPAPKPDAAKLEDFPVPDNNEPLFVFDKDKEVTRATLSVMLKHDPLPRQLKNTIAGIAANYVLMMMEQMLNYRMADYMEDVNVPVTGISAGNGEYIMAHTKEALEVDFSPKAGKDQEALAFAFRELYRAGQLGFTEPEYARAKKDMEANLDQQLEQRKTVKTSKLVDECVEHFLENEVKTDFGTEVGFYKQLCASVPLMAINQAIHGLVGTLDTNLVVLGFYPDKESIKVPTAEETAATLAAVKKEKLQQYETKTVATNLLDKEPKAGRIKKELPVDELGYKGFVLSNGVKIKYKATDFEEGKILAKAISFGGQFKVNPAELDNAKMFNAVMRNNGLGKFSGNDLEKALTGRVVSLAPMMSADEEALEGSSSKKDFRTLFQLMYLYFTDINYDEKNYMKVYKRQETALANRDANPMNALNDSLKMYMYNFSPYSKPFTASSLKNVSYDKIMKIYKERFANVADFTFFFTGALNEDSLKTFAKEYLASIPAKGKLEKATNPGMHFQKGETTCRFSKKMETPQCYVVDLMTGTCPLTVQNQVLGEAVGEMLDIHFTETIREKYGFAYSTFANCQVDEFVGDEGFCVQIIAPVKPEKCDSTILLIRQGLEKIANEGVSDVNLNKIKEQMLKVYETSQRENKYWHSGETELTMYGRNMLKGEKEAIEALTSDKMKQFVKDVILKQKNNLFVIIEPEKK